MCPEYTSVWARDTRRKLSENLSAYRTMRSSRLPSSLLVLRSCTRTAMGTSRLRDDRDYPFCGRARGPSLNPANVAGHTTSSSRLR